MSLVRRTLTNITLPPSEDPLGGWDLYIKTADRAGQRTVSAEADQSLSNEKSAIRDVPTQLLEDGSLRFAGQLDFFTYFNACSLEKWKRYAQVSEVFVELVLDNLNCVFQWVGRSEGDAKTEAITSGVRLSYETWEEDTNGFYRVRIAIPQTDKQVVGFTLQAREATTLREGVYFTMVEERRVNRVVLALCTTTFKKEDFITANVDLVKKGVLASGEEVADNFEMFVIDNGRTLDGDALSADHVHVLPNKNVGGAGGFTRGMMEAIASDRGVTHVLLMDDDVSISPESIKRTYNLLCLASGKYKEAFINGAMLALEEPNKQYEDVSFVRKTGGYHRIKPDLFVDQAKDIVTNEAIDVEVPRAYGAWWFSCIPVSCIKEIGLPLPLFVRCDDVDYGLRADPTYMTMNGICVWHESFGVRFRPSVDCYQYYRNYLISIAADNIASEKLYVARLERDIRLYMRFMSYGTVELLLDAWEDYMKGPDFIAHANGEQIMKEKGAKNEEMVPFDELGEPCLDALEESGRLDGILESARTAPIVKLFRTLPYDRHLLPDAFLPDRQVPAVVTDFTRFAWGSIFSSSIIAVDHRSHEARLRTIDRERYRTLMKRWADIRADYRDRGKEVRAAYRAAQPELTSWEFWKGYLGIDHL